MNKLQTFLTALSLVKNWPVYLADYFKLKKGISVYVLRDGTQCFLRASSNDRNIFNEIFIHKFYNPPGFEIKEGDIVMDIGGHIGMFSLYASATASKVYVFEPFPENFALLQRNVAHNKKTTIVAIDKAVSDTAVTKELFVDTRNQGGHSFYSYPAYKAHALPVQTVSLAQAFSEYQVPHVDFLKIDCEGGEYDILFGCPKDVLARIKKISMEYHPVNERYNATTLKKFLEDNNFSVSVIESLSMLYAINRAGLYE